MTAIKDRVHVNMPFRMSELFHLFISNGLNPEIGLDATSLDSYAVGDFAKVAARFQQMERSVTLHGPFIDLSAGSPDREMLKATRKRLNQLLELVPLFKPQCVVCHAGYEEIRYGWIKDGWLEKSIETWSWLGQAVREAGSRLVLENVYEWSPTDLVELFEALKPCEVGFCLDTGHVASFSRTPLEEWLNVLGPYVTHLHLHDNHGAADEHLPLGSGTIDFTPLWDFLAGRAEWPTLTLEPHVEADLKPSLDYLAGLEIFKLS